MLKWEITLLAIISTHTLTWSVTGERRFKYMKLNISTHTLTWSVTIVFDGKEWNIEISTHTLTWSVTFFLCRGFLSFCHFNSHAHVERDGGGSGQGTAENDFNSHAHVERDLRVKKLVNYQTLFQLTRSRGA